ncbi:MULTISPECIES: HigA family addiction module antitoxin [unclassified Pusillimonas]|uniref:HigA family addiction module antitoxin n=1 Tax=unclassified Pusillimonas TaxID=2640016 RepID=UPI0015714FF7|nr:MULTISPECIES: HigA family addiction module antitoxin [unclassified Pusillimonas]
MNTMHNPPHPGELLHDLWLEPMGLSITAAAKHLHVSRKTLSEIVNGKAAISSEMAVRLELAFGKSAASWLAHQAEYDLWQLKSKRQDLDITRLAPVAA